VISGLKEYDTTDDETQVSQLFEEHFDIKSHIGRLGVRRLGRKTSKPDIASHTKPRRLLVHFDSEIVATDILRSARKLPQSSDTYTARNVFVNQDLSPEDKSLHMPKGCNLVLKKLHLQTQCQVIVAMKPK